MNKSTCEGVFNSELGLSVFYDEEGPAIVVKKEGHGEIRMPCKEMDCIEPGERNSMALAYTGQALVLLALMHPEEEYAGKKVKDIVPIFAGVAGGEDMYEKVTNLSRFIARIIMELGYDCCEAIVKGSNFVLSVSRDIEQGLGGTA